MKKNEKPAGLRGSIWKLHMQAEEHREILLQFLCLLPSCVMGALGEARPAWKRCSTKAPHCSPWFGFGNTEHHVQHKRVCWHQTQFIHHLVINCSHTFIVGTLYPLSFCLMFILCIIDRIWVWVSAQQTLFWSFTVCQTAPFGSCWCQPSSSQMIHLVSRTNIWWFLLSSIICRSPNSVIFLNYCSIWSN